MLKPPPAFSSTYARESAFPDSTWERRALDPLALTFVATTQTLDKNNTQIIASLILRGPFPIAPDTKQEALLDGHTENISAQFFTKLSSLSNPLLQWEINAVYTDRNFRRHGISIAVLAAAINHASRESTRKHSACVITLGITGDNGAARGLYAKAGFEVIGTDDSGSLRFVMYIPGKT